MKNGKLISETKKYRNKNACPKCGYDTITTVTIVNSSPSTGNEHTECLSCGYRRNKMVS